MSLIEIIASSFTGHDQSVAIELSGSGDNLIAKVTPSLGVAPTKATDKEAMLFAALSTPLLVKGSAAEIEQDIIERFKPYSDARAAIAPELKAMQDSSDNAENSATEADTAAEDSSNSPASVLDQQNSDKF